jgi:hypothetical protein
MEIQNKEKPPDISNIYKIIKCPLKSVLKKQNIIQPIIEKTVKDINQLVIFGYQFLRLYLLDKFNNNKQLPIIDKLLILDILKTIGTTETTRGKKKQQKNQDIKDDIKNFYDNKFSQLTNIKISYSNKTHILEQTAKEMLTCIETNTSTHFIKYLFKYINCLFKEPKTKLIKQEKDKEKRKELYKELNKEIRDLKSDLINNKIKDSKPDYHKWINDNIKFLYPNKIIKSVPYDVKVNPEKYIQYAFYINSKLEELNKKPYQILPQRNNIVPKNITLNTVAIVDLLDDKEQKIFNYPKSELVLHSKEHQNHIWSKILKLEKRSIFYNKNYTFYNQISTDGFSCSLLFILKKYKDKKFGDKLPKTVKDEEDKFTKLEDLTKEQCKEYLTNKYKLVSLDPGKKRPITMIDENNNTYKYSAVRRRFDTYTKRSNEIINKEKIKHNIIQKETIISNFNSRTLKTDKYQDFIINKNKINKEIKSFYENMLFRKLSFRRFVRTKQSEEKILNEIEDKYIKNTNKKLIILHGDYSRTSQMKGCISSPNIGIKKILQKKFIIINVNEYNTSKLYNKTFKELTNISIRKGKHKKYLHEILTPKEETEKRIYVNRDINACKNILYLGKYYLKKQLRPKEFEREIIKKKVNRKKNE